AVHSTHLAECTWYVAVSFLDLSKHALERDPHLPRFRGMRVHAIDATGWLTAQTRRIEVLNVLGAVVEQVEETHLHAQARGHLVTGVCAEQRRRPRADGVVLDERIAAEVPQTQRAEHPAGHRTPRHASGNDPLQCAGD